MKKNKEIKEEEEIQEINNTKSKKYLKEFLKKVDEEQNNGPFTLRDSGIVEELHKKFNENAVNYDDEPVVACPHCSSLYLKEIDNNLECFNCGNPLEEGDVIVYSSIISYLNRDENGITSSD